MKLSSFSNGISRLSGSSPRTIWPSMRRCEPSFITRSSGRTYYLSLVILLKPFARADQANPDFTKFQPECPSTQHGDYRVCETPLVQSQRLDGGLVDCTGDRQPVVALEIRKSCSRLYV